MSRYLTAQICQNGHAITFTAEHNPESLQDFCSQCGAKTITKCPSCSAPIRGEHYDDILALTSWGATVNAYCHNCGTPYPWTKSALENASLLIQEDEELSEALKNSVTQSLPDIISETPTTTLAIVRLKKAVAIAGKFTADAIRQFVIDFGCEFAKTLFFGP